MVSRQNIEGRPRPSGVLQTVQDGPLGLADPTPTPVGPVAQGPRARTEVGRRGRGARDGDRERPPTAPPTDELPPGDTPPYPPDKGPDVPVPISPPSAFPGGSRSGGGAGYRARTGTIARETTEEQTAAGRRGRFGQQQVERYGRTRPPGMGAPLTEYGRRYGSSGQGPRWATSEGGGGYGTIPPPIAAPEPPVETPAEEAREPRDRRPRTGRPRTGRGRQG